MTQIDLYGNPAHIVGKKDSDAARQYVLPSDVITKINSLKLKTGASKQDIVSDSIRLSAILHKYLSDDAISRIIEGKSFDLAIGELLKLPPDNMQSMLSAIMSLAIKQLK